VANVERRKDGRPGYAVRWRDEAGRQRKKSFSRKVDADRYRAEVEHSLNLGSYVDPRAGRTTFRDYAEAWRASQPHRPNTAIRARSQLTKHVYPVLGHRPLAAARPSELQALVATLSTTLRPGSVRTVFATVRAIFAAAVRDRVIGNDPCAGVKLPAVHRERIVPLTVDQVDALAAALPARYRAVVVVAAGAGLRQGELFGLRVSDVDFLRRVVKVERQVQPAVGGGYAVTPPKNTASVRTVPVGNVVVTALAEHLREYPADSDGFVFRTRAGGPCTRHTFNQSVWRPAAKAAGLAGVGMHDLRHFYASVLIGAGLNPKAVAERLGHANAAMTLNVYSHLWPSDEDRTRQAIDDMFRRDVPRMRPAEGSST
jgi:integrase